MVSGEEAAWILVLDPAGWTYVPQCQRGGTTRFLGVAFFLGVVTTADHNIRQQYTVILQSQLLVSFDSCFCVVSKIVEFSNDFAFQAVL